MAPLAVRDVEPRRHPLPAVVRQAARRRAEAAEAGRGATRPRPHIMWQYILEISLSVEYFGSTVGHSKRG